MKLAITIAAALLAATTAHADVVARATFRPDVYTLTDTPCPNNRLQRLAIYYRLDEPTEAPSSRACYRVTDGVVHFQWFEINSGRHKVQDRLPTHVFVVGY